MTHILVIFIYYVTKFFVQGNQHKTNRVSIATVISWWRKTEAVSSKRTVSFFYIAESPITDA